MEFVDGLDIDSYLKKSPEKINEIFLQVVDGFTYLESNGILHRDIRPQNIMVSSWGQAKIIDLGFGKQVETVEDFGKSISLNWWCETPEEFSASIYNYQSEVYFVGKLFEKVVQEQGVEDFKYKDVVSRMCERNPSARIASFSEIEKHIQADRFYEIEFEDWERTSYREFSDALYSAVTKIKQGDKYVDDIVRIQVLLEDAYRKCMLEKWVPEVTQVVRCFIDGGYYYNTRYTFSVSVLKGFLRLLKSASNEKKRVVLANLHTKLDSLPRYSSNNIALDDVPF